MNWTDYQQVALSFVAVEGDLGKYTALLLRSEVGEVYGVYAKQERGDSADHRVRLLGELGDVAWGIAVAAHLVGAHEPSFNQALDLQFVDRWLLADELGSSIRTLTNGMKSGRGNLVKAVHAVALDWTWLVTLEGFTVSEVLEYNIAKLTARQAAGTIRGSNRGDNQ